MSQIEVKSSREAATELLLLCPRESSALSQAQADYGPTSARAPAYFHVNFLD